MPEESYKSFVYESVQDFKIQYIESNVIIHFRPAKDWEGKGYGFDWMREIDYSLVSPANAKGDRLKYEDTVSKHYREKFKPSPNPETLTDEQRKSEQAHIAYDALNPYSLEKDGKSYLLEEGVNNYNGTFVTDKESLRTLERIYNYHQIPLKKLEIKKWDDVTFEAYYCPWMSIYPNPDKEIKLSLVAEALDDKMPDSYELEYNNEFFDISLTKEAELKRLTKGTKKGIVDAITLKCKKEFDKDQIISIYTLKGTKRRLAGKMYVWSNEAAKQKKANILSVIVKTKASAKVSIVTSTSFPSSITSPIDTTKELNTHYLHQALVELKEEETIKLDLQGDIHFQPKDAEGNGGHYYSTGGIVGYYTSGFTEYSYELTRWKRKGEPEGYVTLGQYLYGKIKEQLKEQGLDENKYENYSRLYYLDQAIYDTDGIGYLGLGGYSEVENKAIVLQNGAAANTVAHEILHALNLMHSFNNKEYQPSNKYCFKFKTTDNIMDYSHIGFDKIPMNCLWKPQWEVANQSVLPNGSIKSIQQLEDEHLIIPKLNET